MQLLRLAEVQLRDDDRVYSHSRTRAAVLMLAAVFGLGWVIFRAIVAGWKPGYFIAALIFLFLAAMQRFLTARFRASNWLVRMNDEGLLIQFRSYLNYQFPAEDLTVVLLSYGEVQSARLVRERVTVPDPQGHGNQMEFLRHIELELAGDVSALMKALDSELTENAPMQKRWYGRSSTMYQDHPVRMEAPPFLRIRWQVSPGAKQFLNALCPYTTIADPVSLRQDFTNLQLLSRDAQQQRLRELAQRGETIAAVYLARKLYGGGLAEAKQMVDALAAQPAAVARSQP